MKGCECSQIVLLKQKHDHVSDDDNANKTDL